MKSPWKYTSIEFKADSEEGVVKRAKEKLESLRFLVSLNDCTLEKIIKREITEKILL